MSRRRTISFGTLALLWLLAAPAAAGGADPPTPGTDGDAATPDNTTRESLEPLVPEIGGSSPW